MVLVVVVGGGDGGVWLNLSNLVLFASSAVQTVIIKLVVPHKERKWPVTLNCSPGEFTPFFSVAGFRWDDAGKKSLVDQKQ